MAARVTDPTDLSDDLPRARLVVFRSLTTGNLIFALGFRLLGRRVICIEPVGRLRTSPWLKCLARAGIELADFHNYAGMSLSEDLKIAAHYTRTVVDTTFKDPELKALQSDIPDASLTAARSRALMFDLVFNRILRFSEAYALAEYFRNQGIHADVFQSRSEFDALITPILPTAIRNLFPGILTWLIHAIERSPTFTRLIKWGLQTSARALRLRTFLGSSGTNHGRPNTDSFGKDVLYLPHKGVTYGKLFVKDQYYSNDRTNPFHKSNIGHVELAWTMSADERSDVLAEYNSQGIQPHFLEFDGSRNASAWLGHLARMFAELSGPHRLAKAAILALAVLRFKNYRAAMAPCRDARIAVIGYDVLIPAMAALVLQSFGVHVAALQERFINPLYGTSALILNTYFVHGQVIADRVLQDSNHAIDSVVVTGDPRRGRITQHRKDAAAERRKRFKKFRTVCLVLDFHTKPDRLDDPFHFWTDVPSNLLYLSHIADLAEKHRDCAFVIRGKDSSWLKLAEMAPAKNRFESLANVFIDERYDVYDRSYVLAAMADVVVARYTSLCDQCLAEGIPVLVHEPLPNGGKLISAWHDYAPYPILTFSADGLQQRFKDTVLHKRYMEPSQFADMRRNYYGVDDQLKITSSEEALREGLMGVFQRCTPKHHASVQQYDVS